MAPPTLTVRGLSVEYRTPRGLVRAAREVSFELAPGEAIAVIGESGSGKSTLALALMRLLPPSAQVPSGTVLYRAAAEVPPVSVLELAERDLRRFRWSACAMVPQGAINAFNPVMRIAEHFDDTARAHGYLRGAALRERANALMRQVRLEPERVWRAYPHELSGGMRQRVLIALAMLLQPRILILDEPTTALDILTQRSILDVLRELRLASDFSLLFISHDIAVAAELADRIVTMYAGRLVEVGPTGDVLVNPAHPYTLGLLRAMPTLAGSDADVAAIPGSTPDLAALPPGCAFADRCSLALDFCRRVDPPLLEVRSDRLAACHRALEVEAPLAHPLGEGLASA